MGIQDRDYMRERPSSGGGGNWGSGGPRRTVNAVQITVWAIIAINVIIFLAFPGLRGSLIAEDLYAGKVQQLITYQFVHANLLHLICNMLALHFLGQALVHRAGVVAIVLTYLIGGIVGGLLEVFAQTIAGNPIQIVGASASVSALLGLWATVSPHERISLLLFFVIPIRGTVLKIAFGWIGLNVVLAIVTWFFPMTAIAWLGHAGGTAYGLLHGLFVRKGR